MIIYNFGEIHSNYDKGFWIKIVDNASRDIILLMILLTIVDNSITFIFNGAGILGIIFL